MFYTICQTPEDKRLVRDYWEEVRKKTTKIRESYDRANDNKFHNNFYLNLEKNNKVRPDFMEPIPKKTIQR